MASAESDLQVVSGEPASPVFRLGYRAELDGLRGIAVVLVVVYHLDTMWPDLGRALFPGGYLGVDLFLVLSGFLITSLLIGEHDATGAIARRAFLGRRALRLVPALVALLAAVLAVAVVDRALLGHSIYDTLEVATAGAWVLTFTGNWAIVSGHGLGPVGHLWTIALEGQFYVIWGLVLVALLGRRPGLVPAVALTGVAAVAAWRLHQVTARPDDLFSPYLSTLTRLDAPLLGAAAGAWVARERVGWIRGWVADACVVAGLGGVVTAAIVSVRFDVWLFRGGFTLVAAMAALAVAGAVQGRDRTPACW
ncbi:MAG: acyltransferase, partial [Acidimicrobiales bacterium]|nr:acyltransferase [Acidimicrobiales bacterium]